MEKNSEIVAVNPAVENLKRIVRYHVYDFLAKSLPHLKTSLADLLYDAVFEVGSDYENRLATQRDRYTK